jgi:hypothetical protein
MESFEQVSSKPANKLKTGRPTRLIVLGMMGHMPVAGVIWQVLHYLEGFRRLGFEVYYVEDTGTWPYNPEQNTVTADCTYTLSFLSRTMAAFGFSDRWAYRSLTHRGHCFGLSDSQVLRLFEQSDILINLTASTVLRDEHLQVPIRVYLETDPVLPQIEVAKGNSSYIDMLGAHTHHFSYGENLGAPDCGVPLERFHYFPTRQPVVLDWWSGPAHALSNAAISPPHACFTTIANWRQSGKDLDWNGETYTWSKHHEFLKFVELPQLTSTRLELALALKTGMATQERSWTSLNEEEAEAIQFLTAHGWLVVNAMSVSKDIFAYREYILGSRGEFTVAKDQNVRLRSGWFSDRSACYLAAGRPVITQDTGFGKMIPAGTGLFSFSTMEHIVAALDAIESDYKKHRRAAREIAEDYFRAETVLAKLVDDVGI